jgi:group I intron endonuclease
VGQSVDAEERWKEHIYDAFRISTKNYKKYAIQNAIFKYGIDAFTWEIIEEVKTIEESNDAEEFYIAYLNTLSPNGYNLTTGGKNFRRSEETKKKISEKLKIVSSFKGKKGVLHPNFGIHFSEERKLQQSIKLSGDNSSGKKINSVIAREIYLDYINHLTIKELTNKYILKKVAILNILNKKCWKQATKDLPNISLKRKSCNTKLTSQDVLDICNLYKSGNFTMQNLADKYNIMVSVISNIINNKSWKNIKR